MRARLREEIVVTMSVEEAQELRRVCQDLPGFVVLVAVGNALDSILAPKVDHTDGGDERGL